MRWMLGLLTVLLLPASALANEPIGARGAWEGRVDYFMTGTALAVDTNGDFRVDTSAQPAAITVQPSDVPGTLEAAWVYWAGSQAEPAAGACTSGSDPDITLGLPGGGTVAVTADECFCSDGGAATYDVWVCRADVTTDMMAAGGQLAGTYTVDGYTGLFANGSTHNASASILLVYGNAALPPRRVAVFDGDIDLFNMEQVISLTGIEVDTIPSGNLTYYVLEGDISGGGVEQVSVQGLPGGTPIVLSDGVNPVDNPFNQTVNTTTPPQTGIVGVDIDQYDITAALASMDTQVDVTISAGNDKVWLAASVIGVRLFDPAFSQNSTKSVALFDDVNSDGFANPGDTLRYTIRLENDGNEAGSVNITDTVPAEFASYTLVDAAGGTDASTATEVRVNGITVGAGTSKSIIIDMVVDDVPDGTTVTNTASWTAPAQGGLAGMVSSVATEIHNPPVVDPDMGMTTDMGETNPDVGGADMGATDPDMGGQSDAGTLPDGGATDTGSTSGGDTGIGTDPDASSSGPDSGSGSSPKSKDLSNSGCCATTGTTPIRGGWALLVLVGLVLRRRRDV